MNRHCGVFLLLLGFLILIGSTESFGTLSDSHCTEASDCYIIPDVLELACSYDATKCGCQTTISTIHHVELSKDGRCLMSKYGPCGSKSDKKLEVGCLDGLKCIEEQCRDPKSSITIPIETPHKFMRPCKENGCKFNDELSFQCDSDDTVEENVRRCVCKRPLIMDGRSPVWDLRNYYGPHNCSVGQFGPCGHKDGMQVDCHGAGMKCVNGRCINPSKLLSGLKEKCEKTSDCEKGLLCSGSYDCIKPKSLPKYGYCNIDDECVVGLKCKFNNWSNNCL